MNTPDPVKPAAQLSFKAWAMDTVERAAFTYVQALLALVVGVGFGGPSAAMAALIAAAPAGLNIIAQAIFGWTPPKVKNVYLDIVIRSSRTFVYSCTTFLVINLSSGAHMGGAWHAMIRAALVAAFVVVKGSLASLVPGTITPASLAPVVSPQTKS